MKLLIVTGIFPPDSGGPSSYVSQLCKTLQSDKDIKIEALITLADDPKATSEVYSFPIIKIRRSLFYPFRFFVTIVKIVFYGLKSDAIYLNGLVFEGIIASKILIDRPVAVKVVGDLIWEKAKNKNLTSLSIDEFQYIKGWGWLSLLRKLQSWYIAKSDIVITPSEYLRKMVIGWGIKLNNVRVIYNSIAFKELKARRSKSKKYDVITVSRLVSWKGVDSLIEICLRNKWRLRIVGDGPEMNRLVSIVDKKTDLVSFSGILPYGEVQSEIADSKIFVLNSTYEGLPHIVLEAKLAGTPVIATASGGTPETIDHMINGILVNVSNNNDLSNAISFLLDSYERRNVLVKNSYKQINELFSFDVMMEETKKTLLRIAKK
jgi:glycosyltransferase involved in cell wall biosynthesis